jgi:hypothetical protein
MVPMVLATSDTWVPGSFALYLIDEKGGGGGRGGGGGGGGGEKFEE